jgi:hypothetical protein
VDFWSARGPPYTQIEVEHKSEGLSATNSAEWSRVLMFVI